MSCNTRPGPAAICSYIEDTSGYKLTSTDWHTLTQRAEDEGFSVGKHKVVDEDAAAAAKRLREGFMKRDDDPNLAAEMEEKVVEGGLTRNNVAIIEYVTRRGTFAPHEVARVIAERNPKSAAMSDNPTDRLFAAEADLSKKGVAEILMKDERPEVRDRLYSNPTLPPESVLALAMEASPEQARVLANNPAVTEDALMAFAKAARPEFRREAALSSYSTPAVLDLMSRDSSGTLRAMTATNPNLPLGAQKRLLAEAVELDVRLALAKNDHVDESILEELAKDRDWDVRIAVAGNKNTPAKIVEDLFYDDVQRVAARARRRMMAETFKEGS
jgi:hypothetical protein